MSVTGPDEIERLSDVFAALGNETRLEILLRLGSNRTEEGFLEEMSFEELREAVGASSADGFNYHLKKLRGTLVTEGVESYGYEGYTLTYLGYVVYRSICGGLFRRSADVGPHELDQACHFCGHALVVEADLPGQPYVTVECDNCSHGYFSHPLYGAQITDGNVEAVLERLCRQQQLQVEACRRGVCPFCAGPVTREVITDVNRLKGYGKKGGYYVVSTCGRCGERIGSSVGELVRCHPAVVQFCEERGGDVTDPPVWELEFAATDRHTRPVGTDPLRLWVTIPRDGDELAVTVDETGAVVDVEVATDAVPVRAE